MDGFTYEEITKIGHSPIGGSAMHRIMECTGSVGLSYGVDDEEDDTFSKPGTAAHALAERCLREGKDAWAFISMSYVGERHHAGFIRSDLIESEGGVPVNKEMADAVQVYLDFVRRSHPKRNQGNTWIERQFYCPTIHKFFWGTSDLVYLEHTTDAETNQGGLSILHIWDFKYGAGIMVDVPHNPQLMYYAAGVLEDLKLWNAVDVVKLHICQPRGYLEPHRTWQLPTSDLVAWLEDECVPAMDNALVSRDTKSGEHCRFCPARYRACPQLTQDMKELEKMIKELEGKTAEAMDNAQLSKMLRLVRNAKIVGKAAEQTAFKRMANGKHIEGCKLVPAKSNREFKDGAEAAAKKEFGDNAYTKKELLSPAQIEKLAGGEAFCSRWAFKPDKGLTLVFDDDARPAVNKDTKSLFKPVAKRGAK